MKYELIKDFSGWKKGEVYNLWDRIIVWTSPEELERIGIVKKVEEKKKPKFKVGDYAMHVNGKVAVKIHSVLLPNDDDDGFRYSYSNNWKYESELRTPTKEELELYFR